jgi:hypothetical protein
MPAQTGAGIIARAGPAVQPFAVDAWGAGRAPAGFRLGRRHTWAVAELKEWIAAGGPPRERWEGMRASHEVRA